MADYVVKLTAKDNASSTVNAVKESLKSLGKENPKLEEISQRFKQIDSSSAPLKKKLRDIQKVLAEMNYNGLNHTEIFTQMAEAAGGYRDAIADANQAVNAFANDTMDIQAAAQAIQGVAAAGSIAAGVMGSFRC